MDNKLVYIPNDDKPFVEIKIARSKSLDTYTWNRPIYIQDLRYSKKSTFLR